MPTDDVDRAKDLLLKMYIEIKSGIKEELEELEKDKQIEENNDLKELSLLELIDYISKHLKNLFSTKSNNIIEDKSKDISEEDSSKENNLAHQYEELLIKAENDIRKHIKVSIFFKLFLYYIYIYID